MKNEMAEARVKKDEQHQERNSNVGNSVSAIGRCFNCSPFVQVGVELVPLLPLTKIAKQDLARQVKTWAKRLDESETLEGRPERAKRAGRIRCDKQSGLWL